MTEISGGEVLARMLQAEGVEKVFGIIDGTYFGFYSSLHRLGIEIVTPRHETSAAHMAGAYARVTGRLGVCMASNGPGVANLLPGLVVEKAEGNRVLAHHQLPAAADRLPGPRRDLPVLRPGRRRSRMISKWSHAVPSASIASPRLGRRRCATASRAGPASCTSTCPRTIMNGKFEADVA